MFVRDASAVYIHQRKTAGVSVGNALGLAGSPDWHLGNDGVLEPWFEQIRASEPVFVFTCVRNPFDRLVSAWRYLPSTRSRSLEDVLRDPPREGPDRASSTDYRHLARPQSAILVDPATGGLVTDYVMRFERLQETFDEACTLAGIRPIRLHRSNRTWRRRPGYRRYFTATTRRLAEGMFADDLERFGYDF